MKEKEIHNRFKDAPWYNKEPLYILVGGAGGIGSWAAMLLARAGFAPLVYDFDMLERHNLGGQLYPQGLIGQKKVDALQSVIKDFTDETVMVFDEAIDYNTVTNPYVVSAFDNMKARKDMFSKWRDTFSDPNLSTYSPNAIFIDGRLNAEQMWIYCVQAGHLEDIKAYEALLFDDSEIPDEACSFKQTSHAAAMIGAKITQYFTNHITNVVQNDDMREVPFSWELYMPMDLVTIENSKYERVNSEDKL